MSKKDKKETPKKSTYTAPAMDSSLIFPLPTQVGEIGIVSNGTYRKAGHLTDQTLKYRRATDSQLSIFDSLQPKTKAKITDAQVEVEEIVEGIKLSPSETKVVDSLCKLLHEQSQTSDPTRRDYYTGGRGFDEVHYGDSDKEPAPKLYLTLYELTKEYKGGETPSGKDVENVKQILTDLDSKRFLLSYVETTQTPKGGRIERKIEEYQKLIHLSEISQTEYSKEDVILGREEETVIVLNPIFRRQIAGKYIVYPNDITKRTAIAYGSHNISEITLRLRDYLMRELSSKHYKPEIDLENLYLMVAEKWIAEGRKTKVREYTDKALSTVKGLGLLLSYEIRQGAKGQSVIVFTLNKDWE